MSISADVFLPLQPFPWALVLASPRRGRARRKNPLAKTLSPLEKAGERQKGLPAAKHCWKETPRA